MAWHQRMADKKQGVDAAQIESDFIPLVYSRTWFMMVTAFDLFCYTSVR